MGTLECHVESGACLPTPTSGAGGGKLSKMGNEEDRTFHLTEESGDQESVRTAMAWDVNVVFNWCAWGSKMQM